MKYENSGVSVSGEIQSSSRYYLHLIEKSRLIDAEVDENPLFIFSNEAE
jgi:hypothetical protein